MQMSNQRPTMKLMMNSKTNAAFIMSFAGLVRLFSVKTLEYQEHASEYGVHWNFFLTVAAVSTLSTLLPIPKSRSLVAGEERSIRELPNPSVCTDNLLFAVCFTLLSIPCSHIL